MTAALHSTARAHVDLNAIRHNLTLVRRLCSRSRVMAVIKADAYGHGLLPVAKALSDADGLAVARLQEALALRDSGITHRILLLGTLLDEAALETCSRQHIDVTAHDESSVNSIVAHAQVAPLRVWLKLDCGMHRMGLDEPAFVEADRALSTHPGVRELIHMTHFSSAHDRSRRAAESARFWVCHKLASKATVSLANSAALIASHDTHADWVRAGILLYGDNPLNSTHYLPVRTAMTVKARVIALREIGTGQSVGYDGCWTSARPSRVATIGIGYGDGYPRHAKNGTPILINGNMGALVGRVSMDSLTVDITDCGRVSVGDDAILWGPELLPARIAAHADTISYELFTSLTQRVHRNYAIEESVFAGDSVTEVPGDNPDG
jgi:alanine racemase